MQLKKKTDRVPAGDESAANPSGDFPTNRRVTAQKRRDVEEAAELLLGEGGLLRRGLRCSSDILTMESFENAIAVVYALGGSTNAVLHLLAIARDAGVPLAIEDFNRVGRKVPLLSNLSPHGKFHMSDLDAIGGVPVVMKELLANGLIHGHAMTVTGKTVAENLKDVPSLSDAAGGPCNQHAVLLNATKGDRVLYECAAPFAEPGHHLTIVKVGLLEYSREEKKKIN